MPDNHLKRNAAVGVGYPYSTRAATHSSILGHSVWFACRPENTEMWPPGSSMNSLSSLDTTSIRPRAAGAGTMKSWLAATHSSGCRIFDRSTLRPFSTNSPLTNWFLPYICFDNCPKNRPGIPMKSLAHRFIAL